MLIQGNRARDFIEMEQDVNLEEEMQESDDDILESEEISHNTSVQNDETSPSVRSNKRKRRADDVFHNVVGLITESLFEQQKNIQHSQTLSSASCLFDSNHVISSQHFQTHVENYKHVC